MRVPEHDAAGIYQAFAAQQILELWTSSFNSSLKSRQLLTSRQLS